MLTKKEYNKIAEITKETINHNHWEFKTYVERGAEIVLNVLKELYVVDMQNEEKKEWCAIDTETLCKALNEGPIMLYENRDSCGYRFVPGEQAHRYALRTMADMAYKLENCMKEVIERDIRKAEQEEPIKVKCGFCKSGEVSFRINDEGKYEYVKDIETVKDPWERIRNDKIVQWASEQLAVMQEQIDDIRKELDKTK